jgi:mRNA-degrading endonuclease RelE of RelBE toxin-antitoxin system
MGYDIELTEDAERTLTNLAKTNREIARRISRELAALGAEDTPRRFMSQLEGHTLP